MSLVFLALACHAGAPTPVSPPGATMPEPHVSAVPGWLALATARREARTQPWSPVHPNAQVVIVDASDDWFSLDEGMAFSGLAREGTLQLVYSEQSQIPYGWDDVPTVMTAFRVPKDLVEQPVWVLPEGRGGRALTPDAGEPGQWFLGPFAVAVSIDGGGGKVTLTGPSTLEVPWTVPSGPDLDDGPPSLDNPLSLGVPRPLGGFVLDSGEVVLVLRSIIPSGVRLDLLGGKPDAIAVLGRRDLTLGAR